MAKIKEKKAQVKLKNIGKTTDLEDMAKVWFADYCYREEAINSNWDHLSKERKLDWMDDVLLVANYFMEGLISHVKPLPPSTDKTVYGRGYNEGYSAAQTQFIQLVSDIYEKLNKDFENF